MKESCGKFRVVSGLELTKGQDFAIVEYEEERGDSKRKEGFMFSWKRYVAKLSFAIVVTVSCELIALHAVDRHDWWAAGVLFLPLTAWILYVSTMALLSWRDYRREYGDVSTGFWGWLLR